MLCQKVIFNFSTWIIWVYGDSQWNLISVIWLIDKPIIEEKSWITFFTIWIVNLFSSWNIIACFDDKSFFGIIIIPYSLSWAPVIKHICIWDETISFNAFNSYTENSTASHHSDFWVLKKWKLRKIRDFFADQIVVQFNIFFFLFNLFEKWTTFQIP